MFDFLFSYGGYTPHGFCLAWDPRVLWTHIGADLLIALSYFTIPAIILVFLRKRRDPALARPAMLFTAFILLCGVTHLMGIVTLYVPLYGLQAALKLATGVVSAVTAVILWRMLPIGLSIPARGELVRALADREAEIADRIAAQDAAKRNEVLLARKIDELEAVNAELSEFAYAASHDLKSPANTLALVLDEFEIAHGDGLDAQARRELAEAKSVTAGMRAIVEDVLTYSRMVNHDPVVETVELDAVFHEVQRELASDIAARGATVEIGPLPVVSGSHHYYMVLARNLLSNAVKFHDGTRTPRVVVAEVDTGPAHHQAAFRVSDNGIGISRDHSERIFKMFKRLHTEAEFPGTGLGLALCRRAVVHHGGTISVASSPGEGTTFTVTVTRDLNHAGLAA